MSKSAKRWSCSTPPPGERADCQYDIGLALDKVESGAAAAQFFPGGRLEERQSGTEALLRRATAVAHCLPFSRSGDQALVQTSQKQHTSPGSRTLIDREIARAESFLDRPSPPTATSCEPQQGRSGGGMRPAPVVGPQGRRHARREVGAPPAKILAGDRTVDLF